MSLQYLLRVHLCFVNYKKINQSVVAVLSEGASISFKMFRIAWEEMEWIMSLFFGQPRLLTDFQLISLWDWYFPSFFTAVNYKSSNYNVFYSILFSLLCIFVNWYLMFCQKNWSESSFLFSNSVDVTFRTCMSKTNYKWDRIIQKTPN